MSLLDLQRRMAEDVTRPLTPDFSMQPVGDDGRPAAAKISGYIKPNAVLTSFERLEIYNRQYWFRVIDAVSEDYPALSAIVGPKRFDALVCAYLAENPSTSFTLRNLGKNLPAWLDLHPEFTGRRHDLAVDAARVEWACVEAFDGAALPPLTASAALLVSPATVLALQPHLQLLRLHYPVDDAVIAVHRNLPEADIVSNASTLRKTSARPRLPAMRRSDICLAVHRYDDSVYHSRLTAEQFRLLCALRDGDTVQAAIERTLAGSRLAPEEQAATIQEIFAHAAGLGWIAAPARPS
ncbi:MAG TPA: DNA-binding domain-containing protein [Acidobacteriaceae bacterium]|nr:DNA-binding domain-containing protein [Acidobacteriaceae bacterium]